jgi:hypothetical protein
MRECDCFFDPHANEYTRVCVSHFPIMVLRSPSQQPYQALISEHRDSTLGDWTWLHGGTNATA